LEEPSHITEGEARWAKRDKTSRIKIDNPVRFAVLEQRAF
jgi:hypothetical protein